jgi:transposase-like protein
MSLTNLQPVTQRSSAVLSKPQSANQTQTTKISSTKPQSFETLQTPKCPKCGCVSYMRNGYVLGKQRYRCKDCGCNYSRFTKQGYPKEIRKKCMDLFYEGSSLRSISRLLEINISTVINWIREEAKKLPEVEKKYQH